MTLKFNKNAVNDLKAVGIRLFSKLFNGKQICHLKVGQGVNSSNDTSLLEFYRELRVVISADKKNSNFY